MFFSNAHLTLQWQRLAHCRGSRTSRTVSATFRSHKLHILPFISPWLGLLTLSRDQYQERILFNLQSILREYLRVLNTSTTR